MNGHLVVAITGAGPEPNEDGNPVYVAVASRGGTAKVLEHRLKGEMRQAGSSGMRLLEAFISAQRP